MKEKFIFSILSQMGRWVFTLIGSYLFFLYLDVELMGIWALLNSIVNLGFILVNLGFDSIHYQYSSKKDFEEYFGTFLFIKFALVLINVSVSIILIISFGLWNSEYLQIILFILFSKIIVDSLNIFLVHLKAKIRIFKVEIPLFVITIGQNISKIYIALNLSYISDPLLFLGITNFVFNVIYIILILSFSKKDIKINKPQMSIAVNYLKDTKGLIIFSILLVISNNIGSIILDYSFEHTDLAYFSLINTYFIPFFGLISTALIAIYMPLFSQYFERNEKESIQETVHMLEKYTSIFFICIIIMVLTGGELIFSIFLPQYLNSVPILYILTFSSYLTSINRTYFILLISGKKQDVSAIWSIFNVSLKLILLFILIPNQFFIFNMLGMGTIGYALAILIPSLISVFFARYSSKRYFDIKFQKEIFIHFLMGMSSFFIVFLLRIYVLNLLINENLILLTVLITLSIGIFFGFLFIFKILNKNDISIFYESLKLKIYTNSLKEEFSNT